ncbi:1254_t:CDS:2 [Diversispora eburnea]|uniref:tRNA (cytosine(38)-C(5))-methyltransferase n=1 Tax=Diversispora eburnea TaxID=1213867 RepID=A0A9N9FAX8_9GLOM|nr:1254_t:CDS:2 [Diversispora eburnea]
MEISKNSTQTFIRCIEFFSGIGGLHYAFKQAWSNGEVIASFDINIVANSVYKHNFGKNPITKCIESLNVDDIEKYEANCWLLSPPCQPYTRGGKGLDDQDQRAKGLMHLIEILPKLSNPPEYIFLENVLNFEKSRSREKLIIQLYRMNYEIHECLLTPLQFGIPNDRLRYYLMARKKTIIYENIGENIENLEENYFKRSNTNIHRSWPFEYIVRPIDQRSSCFTKSYGSHHIFGSGSLIQTKKLEVFARLHTFPLKPNNSDNFMNNLNNIQDQILLPPRLYDSIKNSSSTNYLEFPDDVSIIQKHRLLGNSLNVFVVAELLRCVLFNY